MLLSIPAEPLFCHRSNHFALHQPIDFLSVRCCIICVCTQPIDSSVRCCVIGFVAGYTGLLEAENFKAGAEGVAYHNIAKGEPLPSENALRNSTITVQPLDVKKPASGLYVFGWTGPGEWMQYEVSINDLNVLLMRKSDACLKHVRRSLLLG